MTTPTFRFKVPFSLTNANAFELLAGFRLAAGSAGWSQGAAMQKVVEAIAGDYKYLHATLSKWCLPQQMKRDSK